jgi:hypothetical protein
MQEGCPQCLCCVEVRPSIREHGPQEVSHIVPVHALKDRHLVLDQAAHGSHVCHVLAQWPDIIMSSSKHRHKAFAANQISRSGTGAVLSLSPGLAKGGSCDLLCVFFHGSELLMHLNETVGNLEG